MPKHDWEKFRADIERLYVLEDKSLAEVVEILATTRGFRARLAELRFHSRCVGSLLLTVFPEQQALVRKEAAAMGLD